MAKTKKAIASKILLTIVGVTILTVILIHLPRILEITVSIPKFREFILSSGHWGPAVFIGFQILQTVVAPIPGEVVQIAGGYIYGTSIGSLYTTAGMLIGAVIAFFFTRYMARSFVEQLLSKSKSRWMTNIMHHEHFPVILFIFFVIPGLPKDLFIYLAALTPIKPLKFFIILLLGRMPWIILSASVGSTIYQQNYVTTVVISVLSVLAFLLGWLYKDKLIHQLTKRNKIKKEERYENGNEFLR
ncbi:TVP38/TMEM64 family protein [Paenibacillus sp. MMS20-IR301]|uniref:TVP38/TMEM64 family protein n=1 Tax=Paenibacillus sp. MMS20-IR301 TaxID=2895946 RepID=UPI0028EA1103|nr:TVP38/TMEM64 family protein [Paenibacillus sp. MMS20-IR301]WNS45212.1 TVP38/TMEM64 family protein [Paenibacillus sp. MMS20-IR301]